ncbi:hypothetical protein D9748_14245 [Staphylococcus aureus]|nr:hypothetical protein D9748_14245 [Staphylococcus aureus]
MWQVLQSLKCSCGRFRFWLLRYLSFFLLFPTCFVSNTFLKTFFVFLHKKITASIKVRLLLIYIQNNMFDLFT